MKKFFISLLKFICIIYLVLLVPKVILLRSSNAAGKTNKKLNVLLGVDNLVHSSQQFASLKSLRFGIVCNQFSFDQFGNRSVDVLIKNGFSIKRIFVLNNNQKGKDKSIFPIRRGLDVSTKIPVSFLSISQEQLAPSVLKNIDTFLIDIQDSGISCDDMSLFLLNMMRVAVNFHKKVVVLDRPNPLGGVIEGPGAIPWRHGLTVGELSSYFNKCFFKDSVNLNIIPLKWWRRNRCFYGIPLKDFSLQTCQESSFLRPLKEIKPVNILHNKNEHFYAILFSEQEKLSPWELRYLKRVSWNLGLRCKDYLYFDKKKNFSKTGIKIQLKEDIDKFSSFNTLLTIARFLGSRKNMKLAFSKSFNAKVGSSSIQKFLQGTISFGVLKKNIEKSLISFYSKSKNCCLYKPLPVVVYPELVKG